MSEETIGYISLQDATRLCSYSQEYLSLRARQGKLKAVKFGRNWVTKESWLKEYLSNVEDYQEKTKKQKKKKGVVKKASSPPKNLPVGDFKFDPNGMGLPLLKASFVFASCAILILLIFNWVFVIQDFNLFFVKPFKNVYQGANYLVSNFNYGFESLSLVTVNKALDFTHSAKMAFKDISLQAENLFKQSLASIDAQMSKDNVSYVYFYLLILIAGFGGGVVRGLVGFVKHQFSYKNVRFNLSYFLAMMFVSGIIGLLAALAVNEIGFTLMGAFTPALAFIIGYAGGDFIENIYKIIIKKSSLYEEK